MVVIVVESARQAQVGRGYRTRLPHPRNVGTRMHARKREACTGVAWFYVSAAGCWPRRSVAGWGCGGLRLGFDSWRSALDTLRAEVDALLRSSVASHGYGGFSLGWRWSSWHGRGAPMLVGLCLHIMSHS